MGINRVSFTAQSIKENFDATIEIRTQQPRHQEVLDPPETPNKLVGYFNGATGYVELYVVDPSGTKMLRI